MTIAFVTQIESKTTGCGVAATTVPVTVYTVLATPTGPWNVADSPPTPSAPDPFFPDRPPQFYYPDDLNMPWVTALEFAIGATWGCATEEEALGDLTTFLHSGHGLKYDTDRGAPGYYGQRSANSFATAAYMSAPNGSKVNCYDQAAAVTVFGRLLGIGVQLAMSRPFGFINTTTLVGGIVTNSPFGGGTPFDTTTTSAYPLINDGTKDRENFNEHAYAILNGKVYDACAGPISGMTLLTYYDTVIDFEANKQWNKRGGVKLFKESAVEMSHSIIVISSLF